MIPTEAEVSLGSKDSEDDEDGEDEYEEEDENDDNDEEDVSFNISYKMCFSFFPAENLISSLS